MRLLRPVLAAAAVAAAATAAPASAAFLPVCTAELVNAAAGASSGCHSGNTPQLGTRTTRTLRVTVVSGAVDAQITCNGGRTSPVIRVYGGQTGATSAIENGVSCFNTITAVTGGTTATGVSTFVYSYIGPVG